MEYLQPTIDDKSALHIPQPIGIRKKPGRKPNPASPALRKAQNRAAQRAFRERKERHLKDLEVTIRQLEDQRNSAVLESNEIKKQLDSYRAEIWYLKGVVLTLQFVCLHHNIHIPTHSPYLTEEDLSEMAKTTSHAIGAYVDAYTKNNISLKPALDSHFSNEDATGMPSLSKKSEQDVDEEQDLEEDDDEDMKEIQQETEIEQTGSNSISAIQYERLQTQIQPAVSHLDTSTARLKPTILQLSIPHDNRIDLIPIPHMRDRMIIFRDQMDYDHCFALLINGAVYHGGDATMSASWVLPPDFFAEYWYLALNYDISKTNAWRKLKGLPEIDVKDTIELYHSSPEATTTTTTTTDYDRPTWTDGMLDQLLENVPTLHTIDSHHLSTGFESGPSNLFNEYLLHRDAIFEHQVINPPPMVDLDRSASIDTTMMELIQSLSTDP